MTPISSRRPVAALLALALWPAFLPGGDLASLAGPLRTRMDAFVASHDQVGVAIALADAGGLAWSAAGGLADRERRVPATPSTVFELGSLSKLFTCLAVMQLREQGKVDLDRPYVAYVPEFRVQSDFPQGGEAITVRMLMTHTAGLVTDDDPWETTQPARHFHRAVLEHVRETRLLFPPGARWNYSSFGTSLLGVLVERLAGQDFAECLQKNVLLPLGMAGASFDLRTQDPARLSAAYHYDPAYDRIPKDEIRPGGSLRASVDETAALLVLLARRGTVSGRRLLSEESLAEMLRLQNPGTPDQPMGLGFMLAPGNASQTLLAYHYGSGRNRSLLLFAPAQGVGLVVALNDAWGSEAFLKEVRTVFLDGIRATK